MTHEEKKMPEFSPVQDLQAYAQELIAHGAPIVVAEKTARIAARPGVPGEQIISWSVDASGAALMEMNAVASMDPKSGISGWVVSKVDEFGNEVIDHNGHNNQWIIDNSTFQKKYEPDPEHPGIYRPVGGPQRFVRLDHGIHVLQWGQECNVDAGGYVNISVPGDYYVIAERDFTDTYRIL